jgi:hypothetical protein
VERRSWDELFDKGDEADVDRDDVGRHNEPDGGNDDGRNDVYITINCR